METNKEFRRERLVLLEGGVSTGEYVLPDYKGDVKKILFTRATAVPVAKYQNGDKIECSGVVLYEIVYLDSEDKLGEASFTTDFDVTLRCDGEGYESSMITARTTNFALRLMGPRRFSGKATIECIAAICEHSEYTVEGDAFTTESMEIRGRVVEIPGAEYAVGEEREFREEIEHLTDAVVDEVEVLLTSVEVGAVSTAMGEGTSEVSAQVKVNVLLKVGDEAPYTIERTVDYKDSVMLDAEGDSSLYATLAITAKEIEVLPLEDGVSLSLHLKMIPEVALRYTTPLRLIADCYSTERDVENTHGEFAYPERIATLTECDRYSYNIESGAVGIENARNILYSAATAKIDTTEIEDDAVHILGIMRFSGIALEIDPEGALSYAPVKIDAPFEKSLKCDTSLPENVRAIVNITVTDAKIMVDGANLALSADVLLHASVTAERRSSCISASTLGEGGAEKDSSRVTVYYPEAGDTLFEIAKKYRTPVMKLAADNELTESVCKRMADTDGLSEIKYLIIR